MLARSCASASVFWVLSPSIAVALETWLRFYSTLPPQSILPTNCSHCLFYSPTDSRALLSPHPLHLRLFGPNIPLFWEKKVYIAVVSTPLPKILLLALPFFYPSADSRALLSPHPLAIGSWGATHLCFGSKKRTSLSFPRRSRKYYCSHSLFYPPNRLTRATMTALIVGSSGPIHLQFESKTRTSLSFPRCSPTGCILVGVDMDGVTSEMENWMDGTAEVSRG